MDTEKQGKDGVGTGAGEQPTQALPLQGTQALDPYATTSLERERMLRAMEAARQQDASGEATLILKPPPFDPDAALRTQGFPLAEVEDMPTDPGLTPSSSPTGPIPVAVGPAPHPGDVPTTQLPPCPALPETRLPEAPEPAEEAPATPALLPDAAPDETQIITRPEAPPSQEPTLLLRVTEPTLEPLPEPVPESAPEPVPAPVEEAPAPAPPTEDLRTRVMPIQAAEAVQKAPAPNPVLSPPPEPQVFAPAPVPEHRSPARLWIAGTILVAGLALGAILVFRPVRPAQPSPPPPQTGPQAPVPPTLKPYMDRALAGDAAAMHMLGVRYYNGLDVPQNKAEGLRWYRRAAEAGDRAAQAELRQLQ